MSDLICGKAAVGGNYNLTRDNKEIKKFKGFKGNGRGYELSFPYWQTVAPDEFKVTTLEKGAYNYAKSGMISELNEILKNKYEHC